MSTIKIDDINMGERFRQDLGDITSFAKRIEKVGLLHNPVVIKLPNGRYQVVCGERRIAAYIELGRTEIEAVIKDIPQSACREAEIAENVDRKDFNLEEIEKIDADFRNEIEAAAKERQKTGEVSENFAKGKSSTKIAALVGKSDRQLEKIRFLKGAAKAHPTLYKPLWDKAKKTNKVDKCYRKAKQISRIEEAKRAALGRIPPANKTNRYDLILGDFRVKCKEIPDNSIDAVFTDPPYAEEFLYLAEPLGLESWRILTPGSSLFIIAPNPGESYEYYSDTIRKCGFKFQHYIPIIHSGGIARLHDNRILVYQKPLLWFYKPGPDGKMTIYKDIKNIIYSDAPDKDVHEWEQSIKEVKHVLDAVTVAEMKVLDPLMGSGTTGEAALELGRYFTGIEINKETYDKAVFRLSQY